MIGVGAGALVTVGACAWLSVWMQAQAPVIVMTRDLLRWPDLETPAARFDLPPPDRWTIEQKQEYRVQVTNLGERTWYPLRPARVILHVMFVGPGDAETVDSRVEAEIPINQDVPPGGQLDMSVSVAAPRKEGTYRLRQQVELEALAGETALPPSETPVTVEVRRSSGRGRSSLDAASLADHPGAHLTAEPEGGRPGAVSAIATRAARGRLSAAIIGQALVVVWPMLFALAAWLYSAGMPYFFDANETYLSYAQGRTMYLFDPRAYAFLTPPDSNVQGEPPVRFYGHNPNLSRYIHLLLFYLHVESLPMHVLLIAIPCSLLTMLLMLDVFARRFPDQCAIWIMVLIVFSLDFMGFLSHTATTFRTFAFIFYWGCLAVVLARGPLLLVGIAFFLLFQFEYAFALFVSVTAFAMIVFNVRRDSWRQVVAMGLGAGASVVVFLAQHIVYHGVPGLIADLGSGYTARGAGAAGPSIVGLTALADVTRAAFVQMYNPVILLMLAWAVLSSFVLLVASPLIRRTVEQRVLARPDRIGLQSAVWTGRVRLYVGQLLTATMLGIAAVMLVLPGYFVDSYLNSRLPLLVFPVTLGIGIVALDLCLIVRLMLRAGSPIVRGAVLVLAFVTCLTPLAVNSVEKLRASPPYGPEYIRRLQSAEFYGQPFVAPGNLHNLVAGLTNGLAAPAALVIDRDDLVRLSKFRNADGQLFYFCLGREDSTKQDCHDAAHKMASDGHQLLYEGDDYVIVELRDRRRVVWTVTRRAPAISRGEHRLSRWYPYVSRRWHDDERRDERWLGRSRQLPGQHRLAGRASGRPEGPDRRLPVLL